MKSALVACFLIMASGSGYAQSWQKVDQKHYGMKYELPASWEIDGFGWAGDWEHVGSAVCECSGTINIGNRFEEDEIFMVAYPTRYKDSLDAVKRNMVWGMVFDKNGKKFTCETNQCFFHVIESKWKGETNGNDGDNVVWQLTTSGKGQYYLIYFWADQEVFKQNLKTIYRIIDSFRPVRAK
jgi:hypothetical protein